MQPVAEVVVYIAILLDEQVAQVVAPAAKKVAEV
jgi:hypothetical protein